MKKPLIRKGDPTSHGGTVLEGSERVRAVGQPVAGKGHMTYCPMCRGDFPISEGVPTVTAFGNHVAVEGMKTACGATLIATQHSVNIEMGDTEHGILPNSPSGSPQSEQSVATGPQKYSGRFRAIDESTGAAVADLAYFIQMPNGRVIEGRTDTEGYTERVSSEKPESVRLRWRTHFHAETPADGQGGDVC